MANSMSLPIPVVGVDTGPNWANAINNCLSLIAEHTHAAGSGVQITPTGLNINAPLLFNGNPLQSAAYLNMLPQGSGVATPINASLYINGVDLFFRDGAGNTIQVTQSGNVLAGSTGIISGTATASFVGSIFTVLQSPGVRAHMDASSLAFKYNGSYQTPPTQSVVIQAPSSIAGSFALTLPTGLPGINNAIMVSNTAGQLTFITADTVAGAITPSGANSIAFNIPASGADAIASTMTSAGANAIAADITAIPAANANVIAAARTRTNGTSVGTGGVAISSSSGVYTSSSNVYVDITNSSVSIAVSGRPVMVGLMAAVNPSFIRTEGIGLRFVRDNGPIIGEYTTNGNFSYPPSRWLIIDTGATAGTHTYKAQIQFQNGTNYTVSNVSLYAYEL